jgi:hypothetical protein
MKHIKNKIGLVLVIAILLTWILSNVDITEAKYKIDDSTETISRIEPKTDIEEFKEKLGIDKV